MNVKWERWRKEEWSAYRHLTRLFGTRRIDEMFRLIVFLIIFLYVGKIFVDLGPGYLVDESFADVIPGPIGSTILTSQCSNETKRCYTVMDYADDEMGIIVRRVIYLQGFEKEVDTMVRLIPPVNRTFKDSDTRIWAINHTDLSSQYIAVLCVFPFVLGSVPSLNNVNSTASILNIGLGGGSLDMFLHTIRPIWKIDVYELDPLVNKLAHEWFGVIDDENRRTYVKDGLLAIREAADKGTVYDVVIVDACDTDPNIPCPADDFLKPHNLQSIKSILKPTGCLLLNVLVLDQKYPDEHIQMIEHRLLLHFPTCVVARMESEDNAVIACLPYSLESTASESTKNHWRTELNSHLTHFSFKFGIQ